MDSPAVTAWYSMRGAASSGCNYSNYLDGSSHQRPLTHSYELSGFITDGQSSFIVSTISCFCTPRHSPAWGSPGRSCSSLLAGWAAAPCTPASLTGIVRKTQNYHSLSKAQVHCLMWKGGVCWLCITSWKFVPKNTHSCLTLHLTRMNLLSEFTINLHLCKNGAQSYPNTIATFITPQILLEQNCKSFVRGRGLEGTAHVKLNNFNSQSVKLNDERINNSLQAAGHLKWDWQIPTINSFTTFTLQWNSWWAPITEQKITLAIKGL